MDLLTDNNLYWIGTRESDIDNTNNIFNKSITIFGSNTNSNISFHTLGNTRGNPNVTNKSLNTFFKEEIYKVLDSDKNAKLMFYNPSLAYKLDERIIKNSICLNNFQLLNFLSNKIYSRFIFSNYIPTLPSKLFLGSDCKIKNLKKFFPKTDAFIIQKKNSSGGFGTFVFNKKNEKEILNNIKPTEVYLISPYKQKSISVNIHSIIFEQDVVILAPSVQIIENSNNRLLYKGADYISFKKINITVQKKVHDFSKKISEILKKSGYRGVCGIDFLIESSDVFFIEVNSRFQASSSLINTTFCQHKLPSIQELNILSFYEKKIKKNYNFNVPIHYSSYAFNQDKNISKHVQHIYNNKFHDKNIFKINYDGFNLSSKIKQDSHLFRVIFNTNITSISYENTLSIYENIVGFKFDKNMKLSELKIRLLNQGVNFTSAALKNLKLEGGVRDAVFNAIDINYKNELFINCPYNIKFSRLSPFLVDYSSQSYHLYCYNQYLIPINIDLNDHSENNLTKTGVPFKKIAKLATDRLRIQHQPICYYKINNNSCKFCNLPNSRALFHLNDIFEVIDHYIKLDNFNHFLIGGGSAKLKFGWNKIIQIASYIRSKSMKKIYLMALPPDNNHILTELHKAGITEVGFNIEIFNRKIAKNLMPGKGQIPIEQYYQTLKEAVKLWGESGNVRSLIILGLEDKETLLKGVQKLCEMKVSPIVSLFRPLPNTPLEYIAPPNYFEIESIMKKINEICVKNNVTLGPSCLKCQNNVLTFANELKTENKKELFVL